MTVLFTTGRLLGLNLLPHGTALDGVSGVLETDTPTLGEEDCVALAASIVGELIVLGHYDERRILDDRQSVARFTDQSLESFVGEAYRIIQENLLFFSLLHMEVRTRLLAVLVKTYSLPPEKIAALPPKVPIVTLSEVEGIHRKAADLLAVFPAV